MKLIVSLVFPFLLAAQGSSVGGSFLKLPLNARTASLGQAVVAEAGEVSSIGVNPANAYSLSGTVILLSNNEWIQGIPNNLLLLRLPFPRAVFPSH